MSSPRLELRQANERLQSELTSRERAALQEEIIATQSARLAEMSTPLIPITDQIMVMPLIGTVGYARALRLLGAHAVLTGLRPELARLLVAEKIDLGTLTTCGTLQSGIAYALERTRA